MAAKKVEKIRGVDFIWMDGQLVPWGEAKVHVLTHALHYGTAVFEGIRAYWNQQKNQLYLLQAAAH